MAPRTTSARPGRTLLAFLAVVALLYTLVATTASWTPALGLDLQGGTRITLQANGSPTTESLEEARAIIDQRVNGSGVSEAEVTTQSGDQIVVEIPGANQRDLVETVRRQAQLRFRLVACSEAAPCGAGAAPAPGTPEQVTPPVPEAPAAGDGAGGGNGANGGGGDGARNANRPPVGFADQPSQAASTSPSPSPEAQTSQAPDESSVVPVEDALAFQDNPTPAAVERYSSFTCRADGVLLDADGEPVRLPDDSLKPLVACSAEEGVVGDADYRPSSKYLLSPAVIQGTSLDDAQAGIPQGQLQWAVSLQMGGEAVERFATISRQLVGTGEQFAIVLDGQVISAPTMRGVIPNGEASIDGSFNETTATNLATSLKYGSLPISFGSDPNVLNIGPSLAGNQLSAGLSAGAVGLLLVMLYCLLYYRGLGLVILASLVVAAGVTYALVLLLAEAAGFTLTLPGIAGLIVAVGITADSFIVFFERIRDEMRAGKSVRVAVEAAWPRARNTCVAADTVSITAAVVLYIFAAGVVKGFAFALGLSTLIDLVVFFFFTKPLVSLLARRRFFSSGHPLSGLSASVLGYDEDPRERPSTDRPTADVGGRL